MKINHIAQTYGIEIQKASGNAKSVSREKDKKGDSVSLSNQGKALNSGAASTEAASNRISALPEIRWDKVNEVKEKLARGFYETQAFKEELAERLIKDFGINS